MASEVGSRIYFGSHKNRLKKLKLLINKKINTMKKIVKLTAILLILAGGFSCKEKDTNDNFITETGMITEIPDPSSCGNYLFFVEKNESMFWYVPDNLPDEFKIRDLPVVVSYVLTDERRNCGFAGNPLVINIKKIVKL
jgi:hypothetical protein